MLDELGTLLREARSFTHGLRGRYPGLSPQPGSAAANDFEQEIFDPSINATLVRDPRVQAGQYLQVASHHLAALGTLFRAGEVHNAPSVLARAVVEHAASAVFVMDPRKDLRTRCARALVNHAKSAANQVRAVASLGAAPDVLDAATEKLEEIEIIADLAFPGQVVRNVNGRILDIAGERTLSYSEVVKFWADWRDDELPGAGVYSALSLWTHPQTWVALESLSYADGRDPQFEEDLTTLHWIAAAAATAWFNGTTLLVSYHGWEVQDELTDWVRRVDDLFPAHRTTRA